MFLTKTEDLFSQGHGARPDSPRVRPANPQDAEAITRLLHEGFRLDHIRSQDWRALLTYEWSTDTDKPNLGFVLTGGDTIIGFLGTVYSRRRLKGQTLSVCNLTSWYVLPQYRGWGALLLLRAALQDKTVAYTSLTPGAEATAIFQALGFRSVERKKFYFSPFGNAKTLLNRRPQLEFRHDQIRKLLSNDERRIFDDHERYDCVHLVVRDGPEQGYLVLKKRPFGRPLLRKIPGTSRLGYSEVLYCSTPKLLSRHLERIKLSVMRRQKTIGFIVGEQMLASPLPRGKNRQHKELYRSHGLDGEAFDMLYSEFVLLPL